MRETTEKRFVFDAITVRRALASCVVVPVIVYYFVAKDSEAWAHGMKGHTAGRRNIPPRPAMDDE